MKSQLMMLALCCCGLIVTATGRAQIVPLSKDSNRMTPLVQAAKKAIPAVVNISTDKLVRVQYTKNIGIATIRSRPRVENRSSLGSGIIIDRRGLVLTNDHLVKQAHRIMVTLSDGTTYAAAPVATSSSYDLALLVIEGYEPVEAAQDIDFGIPDDLLLGESVIAVGNPFELGHSVTAGVLSAVGRQGRRRGEMVFADLLQFNIAFNRGNSGGPVVNADGELIAMGSATQQDAEGISYGIPMKYLENALAVWLIPSRFGRNSCGLIPGTRIENGKCVAFVREVMDNSPAAAAELNPGEVISSFNGVAVRQAIDVSRMLWSLNDGDEVDIVLESGKRVKFAITAPTVTEQLSGEELAVQRLGLELQQLTPKLAKVLNLPDHRGLVISEVMNESILKRQNVNRGDIIRLIGDEPITDFNAVARAFQRIRYGDVVDIMIDRPSHNNSFDRYVVAVAFAD
jgi:serine protease Do